MQALTTKCRESTACIHGLFQVAKNTCAVSGLATRYDSETNAFHSFIALRRPSPAIDLGMRLDLSFSSIPYGGSVTNASIDSSGVARSTWSASPRANR